MNPSAFARDSQESSLGTLVELERTLREACDLIAQLRGELEAGGQPAPEPPAPLPRAVPPPQPEPMAPLQVDSEGPGSTFERLWDRIGHERLGQEADTPAAADGGARRGLALLPQQYLMTVENREGTVDLVPLHRALTSMQHTNEVALLSYTNGTPVVSIRVEGEVDTAMLGQVVGLALNTSCEVIDQGNNKLFLRLTERNNGGT